MRSSVVPERLRRRRGSLIAIGALAAIVVIGLVVHGLRGGGELPRRPARGAPVTVAIAVARELPVTLGAIGSVAAFSTVSIKSRVDGEILAAHFQQGSPVRRGALLFALDPKPFQAQLQQAEANRARDGAQLEDARIELARDAELVKKDYIPRNQYDAARATADALAATVRADGAAVESARLQLGYTQIRSPIDGIAGGLLAYPGNLVKANDVTALVVINQVQPIYVGFALPQQDLARLRARLAAGPLPVTARVAGVPSPQRGEVAFLNNAIDPATGTIQVTARFANRRRVLLPGQFVDVSLVLDDVHGLVVPAQAIQTDQTGTFVFVVGADGTVAQRPVTVAARSGGEAAVTRGLRPGETVVVDGQLGLYPGAKVESRPAGPENGA